MTSGGIAASVGLILDDAIVMIENIVRHVHAATGETSRAIEAAVREMVRPVLTSSLCSIVVYRAARLPDGRHGRLLRLALADGGGRARRLARILPHGRAPARQPPSRRDSRGQAREPAEGGRLDTACVKIMERLLARPSLVLVAVAVAALASWGIYRQLETRLPAGDGRRGVRARLLHASGGVAEESSATLARVERILRETPDVETYSLRTGTQLGGGITEPNQGDFLVKLRRAKRRPIAEVIDGVRHAIATSVPGIQVDFMQLMEDLIGDLTAVPQPVEIKIFGGGPRPDAGHGTSHRR